MRTIRKLLTVAGFIIAATIVVGSAAAAPAFQPLTLVKDCSQFTGNIPSSCTITASNLAVIPVGSKVFYYGPVISNPAFLSSSIILDAGDGNTALGHCNVNRSATPKLGICAFWAGSGSLAGFQAIVMVTADAEKAKVWHWDGSYVLAPSN